MTDRTRCALALVVPSLDGVTPEMDAGLRALQLSLEDAGAVVDLQILANGPEAALHEGAVPMGGNLGFGRAVNRWFEEVGGRYDGFLLINDDLLLRDQPPEARAACRDFALGCVDSGEVGAVIASKVDLHRFPSALTVLLSLSRLQPVAQRLGSRARHGDLTYPSAYFWIVPTSRYASDPSSRFDDGYPLYYEDAALAEQWAQAGSPVQILVDSTIRHGHSATFKGGSADRKEALLAVQAFSGHRWLTRHGWRTTSAAAVVGLGLGLRTISGLPGARLRCLRVLWWWCRTRGTSSPGLPAGAT